MTGTLFWFILIAIISLLWLRRERKQMESGALGPRKGNDTPPIDQNAPQSPPESK